MKKRNILTVLAVVASLVFTMSSCGGSCDDPSKCKKGAKEEVAVVNENVVADAESKLAVEGMVCAMGCAAVIQEELGKVNGVAEATVDFDKELATISYDSKLVSEADLIAAIEGVGDHQYTATVVSEETSAEDEADVTEEVEDVMDVHSTTH